MTSSLHHRRGPWSQAEDHYLMSLVQTQGPLNWVRISQILGSRTAKQCRERYHQNLKPTLNHDPITPEEGVQIERLVRELGKRWAEIARRLHGRSDNAVKNWWNGSQNRRKRMDRRKASHIAYEERPDIQGFGRASLPNLAIPRGLPLPTSCRPLPPPLSAGLHDRFCVETPLPSPPGYSPDSEGAPSLVSDSGSQHSVSPRMGQLRSPELELPPLKIATAGQYSPRPSQSPTETKLPSLSAIVSSSSPAYPQTPMTSAAQAADYMSYQAHSHLPTAPNSPVGMSEQKIQLPPLKADLRDERTTRLPVADLLH